MLRALLIGLGITMCLCLAGLIPYVLTHFLDWWGVGITLALVALLFGYIVYQLEVKDGPTG